MQTQVGIDSWEIIAKDVQTLHDVPLPTSALVRPHNYREVCRQELVHCPVQERDP